MTDTRPMTAPQADPPDGHYTATAHFESPADAVFDAVTTASSLTAWWMSASGSGQEGGALTFRFGGEGVLVMRVDTAEPASLAEWTVLASEPHNDWVGTRVCFDISPTESGGSRLRFQHIGLTPQLECFDMCTKGWDQYIPSLVAYVDGGQGTPRPAGPTRRATSSA